MQPIALAESQQPLKPKEGASHAAVAIAVISGKADIASDYDRNLDVLTSEGRIDRKIEGA